MDKSDPQLKKHRPVSPVPSCVSMKSDWSMENRPIFSHGPPQSWKIPQTQRPVSPVSVWSLDPPQGMNPPQSGLWMTPPQSDLNLCKTRPQTHRPVSPVPSGVSMKSDWSMDRPSYFSNGPPQSWTKAQTHRPASPVPSGVSMRSDWSMENPPLFSDGVPVSWTIPQTHRSVSPVPSGVSMRNDWSMKNPPLFSDQSPVSLIKAQTHRPVSPVPSGVSMKSDWSMENPPLFSNQAPVSLTKPQTYGPVSPVLGGVSMKSDWSMENPPQFSDRPPVPLFMGNVLAQDHSLCGVCEQLLRDPVITSCGHSFCRQCISSCRSQSGPSGEYSCPQCGKGPRTQPILNLNIPMIPPLTTVGHLYKSTTLAQPQPPSQPTAKEQPRQYQQHSALAQHQLYPSDLLFSSFHVNPFSAPAQVQFKRMKPSKGEISFNYPHVLGSCIKTEKEKEESHWMEQLDSRKYTEKGLRRLILAGWCRNPENTAPYGITQEPLNFEKCNDDNDDGKARMREEDSGESSFSPEDEKNVHQESNTINIDPVDIKNDDCDGGSCISDGDIKFRAKTECFGQVSAEKEFDGIKNLSDVPEVFTPECCPHNGRSSYRFTCSSDGLYQCRYTGLVFKMETPGEVEYHTEHWNCRQLEEHGYVPAGPLFDIKCPKGTLSQLRFPHCEVLFGNRFKALKIIHINDQDEFEIRTPHEKTHSYVVLNIDGCSKYGKVTKGRKNHAPLKGPTKRTCKRKHLQEEAFSGLVLLFLQPSRSILHVLLLPKNVVISEVCQERKKMKEQGDDIHVETTLSDFLLVPGGKYCLTCDPHCEVDPETFARFADYGYNIRDYIATFQIDVSRLAKIQIVLKVFDQNEVVWQKKVKFPAERNTADSYPSSPYTPPGQDFFLKHKADLETRLQILSPFLSKLQGLKVINSAERELLNSKPTPTEMNRALLTMLQKRGGKAQEIFYKFLREDDPLLVEDLEKPNEI